tara:strand:- start:25948 stop:26967 length:1020 start_codon:yes stop_codon:yes gene_type:complete
MEENPKEFLYGADQLIKEGKVDALFVSKGKRNTLLRKLLYLIEKPVALTYYLGMPLEIVLENWGKVKRSSMIFCINDAISFAVLFFKLLGLVNVPVVALLQSTSERHRKYFGKNKLAVWFLKKLIQKADLVLALSEPARSVLIDKFDLAPEKVRVFYFGVDNNYWSVFENEKEDFILSVGNDHNRDFKTLVSALADSYKLKIVTRLQVPDHKNIEVLNGISNDELRELYQKSALVVAPSKYIETESSGLSVTLQSMSCGSAVVASRSYAMEEIFKDGQNIFFYQAENHEELKVMVDQLFQNKHKILECGKSARKRVHETYNCSNMSKTLDSIFKEFSLF